MEQGCTKFSMKSLKRASSFRERSQRAKANSKFYSAQSSYKKTNPSSHRRGRPILKHKHGLGMNKNMVMGPDGSETENDCDDEVQRQIRTPLRSEETICWAATSLKYRPSLQGFAAPHSHLTQLSFLTRPSEQHEMPTHSDESCHWCRNS
jgi:hypothetical protein